ncbi:MAG: MBL fold metallo-hydrolase [Chryseolinea sp.]
MLQVQSFEFNPFHENTYILYDETGECVIIDPGCYESDEKEAMVDFITSNRLKVVKLLNTHCHVDHVLGNYFIKEKFGTELYIHEADAPTLKAVSVYGPNYGFHQYQETTADKFLTPGDVVSFGNQKLSVLFVPGHAPGHIAFYNEAASVVISGDVLFYNSVGRTDLPGGNHQTLIKSIREKLYNLPDDVVVYPGHGPKTSIGFEKRTNPFTK